VPEGNTITPSSVDGLDGYWALRLWIISQFTNTLHITPEQA